MPDSMLNTLRKIVQKVSSGADFSQAIRVLVTDTKLAMSTEAAETSAPAVSAMLIYIIMAAVLAVRPQGLFPPKVR